MNIKEIYLEAAKLLERPNGWCTGFFAITSTGENCSIYSIAATSFCVRGAIFRAARITESKLAWTNICTLRVEIPLMKHLRVLCLDRWNDKQTSVGPIVAALREVANSYDLPSCSSTKPSGSVDVGR